MGGSFQIATRWSQTTWLIGQGEGWPVSFVVKLQTGGGMPGAKTIIAFPTSTVCSARTLVFLSPDGWLSLPLSCDVKRPGHSFSS